MAFGVTVDFNANVAKFTKQVDKLSGDLNSFKRKTESSFGAAKNAVAGFATVFGAVKFASFIRSGIDTADMLGKLSTKTGVAVDQLAGLKHAADLSDTSLSEVGLSINKLSIFMSQNAEASKQLGIDAEAPVDAFLQLAEVFSGIEDQQTKAALGNKILGRSYANLAPLLDQGADAIRAQIKEGKEYLPVTAKMAKQAADFNDDLTRLTATTNGYAVALSGPILSGFNTLIEKLQAASKESASFNTKLKVVANVVFDANFDTSKLDELATKIDFQVKKINVLKNEAAADLSQPTLLAGGLIDGILGYDVSKEERRLEVMIRELEALTNEYNQRTAAFSDTVAKDSKKQLSDSQVDAIVNNTKPLKDNTAALKKWNEIKQKANDLSRSASESGNEKKTLEQVQKTIVEKQKLLDLNNKLLQKRLRDEGQTEDSRFNPDAFKDVKPIIIPAKFKVDETGTVFSDLVPEGTEAISLPAKLKLDEASAGFNKIIEDIKNKPPIELPKFNEEIMLENLQSLNERMKSYLAENPLTQTVNLVTSGGGAFDLENEALSSGAR